MPASETANCEIHHSPPSVVLPSRSGCDPTSATLPLLGHEHGQVGWIVSELLPSGLELPHAVGAVGAATTGQVRSHGDDGVDGPDPEVFSANTVVCTENLSSDVVVVKSAKDGV